MSDSKKNKKSERSDLVAYWSVPLLDGVHTVEFEHGTTSGKRVLRVDGQEILRRDWMFKLVGEEYFTLGKQNAKCELRVDPVPYFEFSYNLIVDGKPFEKFTEKQELNNRYWTVLNNEHRYKIVLEKHTLNVWVDAQQIETENVFTEVGTEMRFVLGSTSAAIRASYTHKKDGVIHQLFVDDALVEEDCSKTVLQSS